MVSALDFQAGYRGFESRSVRDNFQTIITPSSYSTCPGLSIKWTWRRLVTDSGTKCAWVIHESKAVQIHVHHSNCRCLHVPRVPGSVKNPHNKQQSPFTAFNFPSKSTHSLLDEQTAVLDRWSERGLIPQASAAQSKVLNTQLKRLS